MLLAEAQHRRLHSAFEWVWAHIGADISLLKGRTLWIYIYRGSYLAHQKACRQEEAEGEEAAAAAGEEMSCWVHTIGDCELRSLLIMHQVTFLISAVPPGCAFQLWLHLSHLWTSCQKNAPRIFYMSCINKLWWNLALCIAGILKFGLICIRCLAYDRYILQSKHTAGRNPARVKSLCPMRGPASPDIIMTDIMGLRQFRKFVKGVFHQYRFVTHGGFSGWISAVN